MYSIITNKYLLCLGKARAKKDTPKEITQFKLERHIDISEIELSYLPNNQYIYKRCY